VVVPAGLAPALVTRLDQLIFSEDVRVSDVSDATAQIAVIGGQAANAVASACSQALDADLKVRATCDASRVGPLIPFEQIGTADTFVARSDDTLLPSFHLFTAADRRDHLVSALERAGATPIDRDLQQSLRIEAARPEFGVDMSTDTIPLEAGLLDRAISTSKGCYVGQEVIVRVLHRGGGRVAKRLVTLALDPGVQTLPAPGTQLHVDGREVGRITSAAWSPHEPRAIALGYLHRDFAEPGRRVIVQIGGVEAVAEVTRLAG
jgi:folate-binding protein YgfZ